MTFYNFELGMTVLIDFGVIFAKIMATSVLSVIPPCFKWLQF